MRTKILIVVLFAGGLLALFVNRELTYTSKWDELCVGMSRQEVHRIIGEGAAEFSEWKPPTYRDSGLIVWHQLRIDYGKCSDWTPEKGGWMAQGGCVHSISIERYVGEHHPIGFVRLTK